MATAQNLAQSIDTAFAAMEQKRKSFQIEETQKHKEWEQRLDKLGKTFDSLRDVWTPRLEILIKKFGDKVVATPALSPSTRDATLEIKSEVARMRLRFRATTDSDIRKFILNYDLDIVPVLMQFEPHAELEMPLDGVDREAVGNWLDKQILSFVQTYVAIHENQYYLRDQMVQDPITGTEFAKQAAGAKLEQDGRTYYFVSEDTLQQFKKRGAAAAKTAVPQKSRA